MSAGTHFRGTLGIQNANAVDITGGEVDNLSSLSMLSVGPTTAPPIFDLKTDNVPTRIFAIDVADSGTTDKYVSWIISQNTAWDGDSWSARDVANESCARLALEYQFIQSGETQVELNLDTAPAGTGVPVWQTRVFDFVQFVKGANAGKGYITFGQPLKIDPNLDGTIQDGHGGSALNVDGVIDASQLIRCYGTSATGQGVGFRATNTATDRNTIGLTLIGSHATTPRTWALIIDSGATGSRNLSIRDGTAAADRLSFDINGAISPGGANNFQLRSNDFSIGYDFNCANSAAQPNANRPFFRVAGGSNDSIILNAGNTTASVQICVDLGRGVILPIGTAASPAIAFTGDTDTGVFRTATADTIGFACAGAEIARVTSTGISLATGETLQVNGTQIATARQTGWTAGSGTATRTTFDTATVTTEQLAQRVKALLDDLITHGLIGT